MGGRKIFFHDDEHFIADSAAIIGHVILHNQASVWNADIYVRRSKLYREKPKPQD